MKPGYMPGYDQAGDHRTFVVEYYTESTLSLITSIPHTSSLQWREDLKSNGEREEVGKLNVHEIG